MNILPVEIWDPCLGVSLANAHLQPYICSVVKLGLELIPQGKRKSMKSMKGLTSEDLFPMITGFMISDLYASSPIKGTEDCAHTWQGVGVFGIKGPF